jgi:hypothetical protein
MIVNDQRRLLLIGPPSRIDLGIHLRRGGGVVVGEVAAHDYPGGWQRYGHIVVKRSKVLPKHGTN